MDIEKLLSLREGITHGPDLLDAIAALKSRAEAAEARLAHSALRHAEVKSAALEYLDRAKAAEAENAALRTAVEALAENWSRVTRLMQVSGAELRKAVGHDGGDNG